MVQSDNGKQEIARRLRYAMAKEGWALHGSQARLASLTGRTPKAASKWVNGESVPRRDNLSAIARELRVRLPWLEYGEGPMEVGTMEAADPENSETIPAAPSVGEAGEINIPQYNTGGMGGNGLVLKDQPGIIQKWSVSHEWLRANVPHHTSVKNLCIVTGFGDSMPETYSPGDPLIVDLGVTACDHDGVYFFRVDNMGFIKRLQRIPGQGIRVLSQNEEYESWTITPDMDFEVFGKVLRAWLGRNY